MFTGLVDAQGVLRARRNAGSGGARLVIGAPYTDLELGESVAVDGVCLTVDTIRDAGFEADASSETLARTTLGQVSLGGPVNLERAMRPDGRLGGHLVSGHVDAVARLVRREMLGNAERFEFELPNELARFVASKGSITLSGTSLTVNEVTETTFSVALIPHTAAKTKLGALRPGDTVNLEVDLVARYVARLLSFANTAPPQSTSAVATDDAWRERLASLGYL